MRSKVKFCLLLFTTFVSLSVLAEEQEGIAKHYEALAQNTLAVSMLEIGYKAYSTDCGSKQAGNQKILDRWKLRNNEVSRNIFLAKEIAYRKVVEILGKPEAEKLELGIKQKLSMAEELITESSLRDSKTGNYDCAKDLKKIENGYLDIETMFPGISKSIKGYIERNNHISR